MPSPPSRAWFRFYAELNDHLPQDRRHQAFERAFLLPASVKDFIESLGVPHTEVDLILINGESSDFSRLIRDGDHVSVYPVFESLDIGTVALLRPEPLRETRFVLDVHLGKLAGYLRMLGFDTHYTNSADDHELVRISRDQRRILLTRDRGLLRHSDVTHGYWVRATDSRRQLEEVVHRFDLARALHPFTRCMICNQPLQPAARAEIEPYVPARALEQCGQFMQCPGCGRVYWEGTHFRRMREWINELSTAR